MCTNIHSIYDSVSHGVSIGICVRTKSVEPSSRPATFQLSTFEFKFKNCTVFPSTARQPVPFVLGTLPPAATSTSTTAVNGSDQPCPALYHGEIKSKAATIRSRERGHRARHTPPSHSLSLSSRHSPSHIVPLVSTIRRHSEPPPPFDAIRSHH